MLITKYLEDIFANKVKIEQEYEYPEKSVSTFTFFTQNLGLLKIKEGKIIACDPFEANNLTYCQPFKNDFPTGDFLCQLAIAICEDYKSIAFSRLLFADTKPIRWEIAVAENVANVNLDNMDKESLENELGYGVDSGSGGFMDISAQLAYKKEMDNDEDYWEQIQYAMYENDDLDCNYCIWEINDTNIAFFSSGSGDGSFLTYIGYDSNGAICQLVTDLGVVNDNASFLVND